MIRLLQFTTPLDDTIQDSSNLLEVRSFTCHLFLDLVFLDIILMRSSTADRSPPIVMSSLCTVATMCSPLMRPCHTHEHAIPLVNLRSLSVDASSSSQFCGASRVPYKLYCNSPHMFFL